MLRGFVSNVMNAEVFSTSYVHLGVLSEDMLAAGDEPICWLDLNPVKRKQRSEECCCPSRGSSGRCR